jgi:hypothetical protein
VLCCRGVCPTRWAGDETDVRRWDFVELQPRERRQTEGGATAKPVSYNAQLRDPHELSG